jgi:hypothetical protein
MKETSTESNRATDPNTVLVVGSGAVMNAWDPIVLAVQSEYPRVTTPDQAGTALANLVFNLRWWHHAQEEELDREGAIRESSRRAVDGYRKALQNVCKHDRDRARTS